MPTNPDHFYLTAEDYRDQTKVPNLITPLTEEEVQEVLLETMALMDAYIGSGWTPYDDEQEFLFPRSADEDANGEASIPRSIALATRMIADAIVEERKSGVLPHMVVSEGNEGHSYTKHAQSAEVDFGFEVFPPSARALLERYRRVGGRFALSEERTVL